MSKGKRTSPNPNESDDQGAQKRQDKSESPKYDGGESSNGSSAQVNGSGNNQDVRFGGSGGSSSNETGRVVTNSGGEFTSSSPFDTSPILPSQEERDKLEEALVKFRELETLGSFWNSLNPMGKKEVSKPESYDSSKIDAPVDYDWKSLNPNVNQPTPTTRKLEIDIDSEAHQTRNDKRRNRSGSSANGGGALDEDDVFRAVRSRSSNVGGLGSVGGSSSSDRGGFSGVGGSSSNGAKGASSSNDVRAPNPDEGSGAFGSRSSNVGGFSGVGGSSSNGAKGASSSNDVRAPNPAGGFSARRESSNVGGLLGGVGGSYSNGGVGGVDYRESGASAFTMFKRDDEFLNGVKNLEHLQRDSIKINQSQESHQQEAPSSSTASSSSSMPSSPTASSSSSMPSSSTASSSSSMSSSPTPSESPASTFGSSGLGGVNDKSNNAMGG